MRRRLWMTIALVVTAASALLTGCGAGAGTPPGPASAPASAPDVAPTSGAAEPVTEVMIIRHGEKPDGSAEGVDAQGKQDDKSLTEVGWARARALVGLFDPAAGRTRAGLARPSAIYAAGGA